MMMKTKTIIFLQRIFYKTVLQRSAFFFKFNLLKFSESIIFLTIIKNYTIFFFFEYIFMF